MPALPWNLGANRSPVRSFSKTFYAECIMPAATRLVLPADVGELACYVVSGGLHIDGERYAGGTMAVACPGHRVEIEAAEDSRVMLIGGEPVGERHIWWNFVSSSRERIEQAKADWRDGRFAHVPGD